MATSSAAGDSRGLRGDDDKGERWVDYRGRPVIRSATGGWMSASFIIGVEMAERFAYYGIASNLISYLTGPLHQSIASAAANVNVWSGVGSMLPLLGAFIADSYLGRYRTILLSSLLYVLGLGLLTLSASLPSVHLPDFGSKMKIMSRASSTQFQVLFFISLYLVALAQGGHKPCVQAFGADQFDRRDPHESKSASSFFNWWYFSFSGSILVALWVVTYIQDNLSWGLGFGIPCISMAIALVVFLLGTKTYRYSMPEEKSPFMRFLQVFVATTRNWWASKSTTDKSHHPLLADEEIKRPHSDCHTQFRFLDQAAAFSDGPDCSEKGWSLCSVSQVEEAKGLLRLFPIWATCLIYAVVFSQSPTFFTKQGSTMERGSGSGFQIPAATLQTFISLSIVITVPIYDRVFIPIVRSFTGFPSGVTMLQRIGIGMFLSAVSMVVAAMVEAQRLVVARDAGLVDMPMVTVPMSVWWLIPQYALSGVADVFTMIGLQEFFYDQVPDALRSLGLSLYLSIFGIGSFLSGFLVSVIEKVSSGPGRYSWFSNNLNRAHLDYFYWLLAGLSAVGLAIYLHFAKSYVYKNGKRESAA